MDLWTVDRRMWMHRHGTLLFDWRQPSGELCFDLLNDVHYKQKAGWTGLGGCFFSLQPATLASLCARCIKHLCGTQKTTLIDTCLLGHQGLAFRLNQFPTLWRDIEKHKARVHKATRWNAHTHSMIQSSTLSIQRDLFIFGQKRSSSSSSDGNYTKRGPTGWRYSIWIAVRVESIIDSPSG